MKRSDTMSRSFRREVALCLVLLTIVVSITLYLTVFSLHGSSAAMKVQIKSRLINNVKDSRQVIETNTLRISYDIDARSNYTIKYGKSGEMPMNAGEVHNEEELQYSRRGMSNHAFNVIISDRIGPSARPIPDTRNELCGKKTYSNISITASVVICFHKESFSALFRTVSSVVERTPPQLLQEIILVDDFSNMVEKDEEIMSFLEQNYPYGKVRILHTAERVGLIGARVKGAKEATGDVVIFLDSHCEANVGWIEPLLDLVQKNRKTVVCPVVDIINPNTMSYTPSPLMRGGFNWGLHFSWESPPKEPVDPSQPFASPTMSGGLFAINRLYFKEIGYYDEDMKEWGGENLEISFRIWMCGGELVIAPCSRVGHIFRKRRPNSIPGEDNPGRNSARVAAVWLDDYKKHFFNKRGLKAPDYGDITARRKLRDELKCHDFKWYLTNVYPEIEIPGERQSRIRFHSSPLAPGDIARGHIRVAGIELCLQSDGEKGSLIVAKKCSPKAASQMWRLTDIGELRFGADSRLCVDASSSQNPRLLKCDGGNGTQKWAFYPETGAPTSKGLQGRLYSVSEGLCLQLAGGDLSDKYELMMQICSRPMVQVFSMEPA